MTSLTPQPRYLAAMKSNNYLVNAVCAMDAAERGGHYGLQLDERGNVAELAIGSVVVVIDGWVYTPKLDRILRSTTVVRPSASQTCRHSAIIDETSHIDAH